MSVTRAILFFATLFAGSACHDERKLMLNSLQAAVGYRDMAAVERLVASGADLEQRDENGGTPLIAATASSQFLIAERLVAGGADIWAYDSFGMTAGRLIQGSLTPVASNEGQARERVREAMRLRGFPFPAPDRSQVLEMIKTAEWTKLKNADPGPSR